MFHLLDIIFALLSLSLFIALPLGVLYWVYKSVCKNTPFYGEVRFPKYFGWILGALIIATNLFIFDAVHWSTYIPSIGPGLFIVSAAAALFFSLDKSKRNALSGSLASLAALAGLALVWRNSGLVHVVNILFAIASLSSLYAIHIYDEIRWEGRWFLRAKWHSFWAYLRHFYELGRLSLPKKGGNNKIMTAIKTIAITLVVLGFFIGLLVDADPVFADLIREFLDQITDRIVLSAVVGILALFMLSFKLNSKKITTKSFNLLGFYDFAVPSALLIVLFGVFLSVQAHYLFGTHADFTSFNLTYSEYVRKGFRELLIAIFFGGLLNYALILKQKSESKAGNINVLRGLNAVLVLELVALLISALKRNLLYMDVYSLTRMRIVGMLILAWLGIFLLAVLIVNLSKQQKEWWIYASMGLATALCVASLNFMNVDLIIAKAMPPAGQSLDTFYIVNLSEDAASTWPSIVEDAQSFYESIRTKSALSEDEGVQFAEYKMTLASLTDTFEMWKKMEEDKNGPLYANISHSQALNIYKENLPLFEETLPCLTEEMRDYQLSYGQYFTDEIRHRLVDYEYPLTTIRFQGYYYLENQSTIMSRALEEDQENDSFSSDIRMQDLTEDPELLIDFLKLHTPDACPL